MNPINSNPPTKYYFRHSEVNTGAMSVHSHRNTVGKPSIRQVIIITLGLVAIVVDLYLMPHFSLFDIMSAFGCKSGNANHLPVQFHRSPTYLTH